MQKSLRRLCAVHDGITQFAAILAGIGLILIVSSYVYEVITRYLFNAPTAWVSDFVSYALCACVFLALPKVTRDKGHVAVTILVDNLPDQLAGFMHTVINIIGFACLGFAAIVSFQENWRQFTKNIETLAIIPIPQWWVSGFITFGLLFSAFYMLRQAHPNERRSESMLMQRAD